MARSKRNRLVSLTATKKKGWELKSRLVEKARRYVDKYERIFVIRAENMRNATLKVLRNDFRTSRLLYGKNKVISIGLGRTKSDEYKKNLHQLSKLLSGQCGLLFTNLTKEDIFKTYHQTDFARTGDVATETIELYQGYQDQFPDNMLPHLRQLGMPITLQNGRVVLLKDFVVCRQGEKLNWKQARMLKLMENPMIQFRIQIDGMWNNGTLELFSKSQNIKNYENADEEKDDEYDDDDDDDDDDE